MTVEDVIYDLNGIAVDHDYELGLPTYDNYKMILMRNKVVEFAKFHVKAALEAVYEQNEEILDKNIIFFSYPLENIK